MDGAMFKASYATDLILSLGLERVFVGWKQSCWVYCTDPSVSSDYRPVTLTSQIMKASEGLFPESL